MANKDAWVYQLDWLNIVSILGLESINEIPEYKKEKAIKKLSKQYGDDLLNSLSPYELDELIANELKDIMKKELIIQQKIKERQERELQTRVAPFKKVIGTYIDPDEFMKFFDKTIKRGEDDDTDDDTDYNDDDKNGYYI